MRPAIDQLVRLKHDLPERELQRGEVGIVRSTWFSPATAYEVEFSVEKRDYKTRVVLLEQEFDVEDDAASIAQR